MSALDFAARAGAQEAREMAEAVVGTAEAARGAAAKAEGAAQAALTASDAMGKALDASRQEMEAARTAADVAGKTAQAADSAAQAASGVAQQAERLAREATAGAPRLFTSMAAAILPSRVTLVGSNGYAKVGTGAATYVSDAHATAALAAANPLACFKGEGNRYFRLMPDAQGAITPEQFGCPIPATGINAQPYCQAALDYAAAVPGIKQISFTQDYDWWCPIRPSGMPTTDNSVGHYLYVRSAVKLVGTASSKVTIRLLNSEGGPNDTITQRVALPGIAGYEGGHDENNYPWIGSAIRYVAAAPIEFAHIENIWFKGTYTYDEAKFYNASGGRTLYSVNLMNKWFVSDNNVKRIFLRNVKATDFAGEIYYTAGSEWPALEELDNCEFRGSPQCALNPQTASVGYYTNCVFADAYQNEIIGGLGKTFNGGLWSNLRSVAVLGGAAGDGRFHGAEGYKYAYPFRGPTAPTITFNGLRIEKCPSVELGPYMRGTTYLVDSSVGLTSRFGYLEDIDLDIHAQADSVRGLDAVTMGGVNPTEQFPSAPPGVLRRLPRNINVRIHLTQSRQARDTPISGDGQARLAYASGFRLFGGEMDGETIQIMVDGIANDACRTDTISGQAPQIVIAPTFKRANPSINPIGLTYLDTAGEKEIPVLPGDNPVALDGAEGSRVVRMGGAQAGRSWSWAEGQEASFIIRGAPGAAGYGDGRVAAVFSATAASEYFVPETRILAHGGDRIVFRRDKQRGRWVEVSCESKAKVRFTGSGNIPAQQIAAGATVNIDFAVPGVRAARHDVAEWVEPTPGFITSGSVISNDLVRVSVTNASAVSAALPGGIRRIRVLNGYAL
jgi:hypothetical protein